MKNTIKAYTKEGDFVPTLYVDGEITTNGEEPLVGLEEADSQGINPKILLLTQSPDVYDPNGKSLLRVRNFSKALSSNDQYTSVSIEGRKGNIDLDVKHEPRSK